MILVCSMEPIRYPIPELRERIREEPFRSALAWTWRATDLEGFLARYAAGPPMAAAIAQQEGAWLNTDDRTLVEFGFARTLGRVDLFDIEEVRRLAREMNWHRPDTVGGEVDWDRVDELFLHLITLENLAVSPSSGLSEERNCRARALGAFIEGDYQGVLDAWNAQPREARYPIEQTMVAEALANAGDPGALPLIAALREFQPTEADAILARLYWREGKAQEAADTLISAFLGYRTHPWALTCVTARAFALAHEIASKEPSLAGGIAGALDRPFAVYYADETRRHTALRVAAQLGDAQAAPYVEAFEPHIPWDEDFLRIRSNAYQAAGHPLASQAATDLRRFLKGESTRFKPLFLYKATHEGS